VDPYLELLILVAALFFVPKALQRFRIPAPVTECVLGLLLGPAVFAWIEPRPMLEGLAAFGISALFLFAGLEVDFGELRQRGGALGVHLAIQVVLVGVAAIAGQRVGLTPAVAVLVGAAVMSPSVGYILATLEARPVRADLSAWIKQKAIAGEILAVVVVLVFANSARPRELALGLGAVAGILVGVPLLILLFHRLVRPWAPRTEFSFLLVVALLAAYVSHHVGVHYLAGAFAVGIISRRYLDQFVARTAEASSFGEALTAFRFFAAFFVPFFFFLAGLTLPPSAISGQSARLAGLLLLVALPLRVIPTLLHRRVGMGESWRESAQVSLALIPTMVFTFAVAGLLRERFDIPPAVYGGLILYGAATSLIPLLTPGAPPETGDEILEAAEHEIRSALGRSREAAPP